MRISTMRVSFSSETLRMMEPQPVMTAIMSSTANSMREASSTTSWATLLPDSSMPVASSGTSNSSK